MPEATETKPASTPKLPQMRFKHPPALAAGVLFNTFRLGKKWADAVKPGDVVELIRDGADKPSATAKVVSTHTGKWEEMKMLAADNYAVRAFTPLEAQSMLKDQLAGIYKSFDDDATLSVVYLRIQL